MVPFPEQMLVLPEIERVGVGVTLTVTVFWSVQFPLAPVSVNVAVEEGLTLMVELLTETKPVFQVYEVAPVPVRVVPLPEQMLVLPLTLTVGVVVTETVTDFAMGHALSYVLTV